MTSGERERVPFMPHDNFVGGSEAVGRILVKGYISTSYFPIFFQRHVYTYIHAYIHTSLFNNAGYENWQDQSPDVDLANYS